MHSWHIMGKLSDHDAQSLRAHLRHALSGIMLGMACGMFVLACSRAVFVNIFAGGALQRIDAGTLASFLSASMLLDLKYAAHAYVPALAAAVIFGVCRSWAAFYRRLFVLLNMLALAVLSAASMVNFYHFKSQDRIFDARSLRALLEDPAGTLYSVITGYPVCWLLLWLGLLVWAYRKCFTAWHRRLENGLWLPEGALATTAVLLVLLAFYVLMLRGSLGPQPLGMRDTEISVEPRVNAAVPNGPAALYWAWRTSGHPLRIESVSEGELDALYARLGLGVAWPGDRYGPLRQVSPRNALLEHDPPDIVLSFMESMSTHLLRYDDPQRRDLLGELRGHAAEDIWFANALASGSDTMGSLTRTLLGVPDGALAASEGAELTFITNLLRPYKSKGYHIVFLTAGDGALQDVGRFLLAQGVDEIIDYHGLLSDYPDARALPGGTDDAPMWTAVYDYLKQGHAQPMLIITLSRTHRPPYTLAEEDAGPPLELSREERKRFPHTDMTAILATFRYANDQLGRFITRIKQDPDLHNTFIAVTGDHNLPVISYTDYPEEMALGCAVPIYLYIPAHYHQAGKLQFDPQAYVSHKDLLTTLIRHTLSEAEYYSLGCDMLGRSRCVYDYAVSERLAIPRGSSLLCGFATTRLGPFAYPLQAGTLLSDPRQPRLGVAECERAQLFATLERKLYHFQLLHQPAEEEHPQPAAGAGDEAEAGTGDTGHGP